MKVVDESSQTDKSRLDTGFETKTDENALGSHSGQDIVASRNVAVLRVLRLYGIRSQGFEHKDRSRSDEIE